MKPWQKIPSSVIRASMRQRLADDRAATEYEALGEMHVLEESGDLAAMSFLALANYFRWTRHRLRAVLAAWGKVAATMPDQRGAVPSMALPPTQPDNIATTPRQSADNAPTTKRQRRATFKANFRVSGDNSPTAIRQPPDNSPTPSCARVSSGEEEVDGEILTPTSSSPESLSAEQKRNPAPAAAPPADDDFCPAELIPLPSRAPAQAALVLLSPAPLVIADREGTPEDLLQLLNDLRFELHPRILRADPKRLQALALTGTRRKALTRGWVDLAKVTRPEGERRALLRLGVLYTYLSDSFAAQGARSVAEPIDTLLREKHLTNYCERGRTDAAALERVYAELIAHPIGWAPDPFDPARFRRRA